MTAPIRIMPEIISRKEAIARGLKRYCTGKPCKRGHFCERTLAAGHCVECERLRINRSGRSNPERVRLWYLRNPNKRGEYARRWRLKNPEKVKAMAARRNKKHRAKYGPHPKQKQYQRDRYRKMTAAYRALRELGIEV
jgi:hypothetical protein